LYRYTKEMRVKLTRFAYKLKNSAMIGAWGRWCEFTEESISLKNKMNKAIARMRNRAMVGLYKLNKVDP
jgi:hypothetical protein